MVAKLLQGALYPGACFIFLSWGLADPMLSCRASEGDLELLTLPLLPVPVLSCVVVSCETGPMSTMSPAHREPASLSPVCPCWNLVLFYHSVFSKWDWKVQMNFAYTVLRMVCDHESVSKCHP